MSLALPAQPREPVQRATRPGRPQDPLRRKAGSFAGEGEIPTSTAPSDHDALEGCTRGRAEGAWRITGAPLAASIQAAILIKTTPPQKGRAYSSMCVGYVRPGTADQPSRSGALWPLHIVPLLSH